MSAEKIERNKILHEEKMLLVNIHREANDLKVVLLKEHQHPQRTLE